MITICDLKVENAKLQLVTCLCNSCGKILKDEKKGNRVMYIRVENYGKVNLIWFCHKCRIYFQRLNSKVIKYGESGGK